MSNEEFSDTFINGLWINNSYIPEELLTYMFTFFDLKDLLNCKLVCRCWKELIDYYVWKEKSLLSKYSFAGIPEREKIRLHFPWQLYYVICAKDPFNRNLIENHCGQEQMKHWKLKRGSFGRETSGWNVEITPLGSNPLPNHDDFNGCTSCFVTSYELCSKRQIVCLEQYGFSAEIMDKYQPTIIASEWYAGRFDCGCKYTLSVHLLDKNLRRIASKEEKRQVSQWEGNEWQKVEIRFENYGPNVSNILFSHNGTDTQFWSGHYGSKMSGAVLKVLLPLDVNENQQQLPNEN